MQTRHFVFFATVTTRMPDRYFFGLFSRLKGKEVALAWFEQQGNHDNPQFFEPVGWVSWAVCMAEVENWNEALQRPRHLARELG